ncbi:MAG: S41 family peptidase, partial [Bacteroidota bacterium]
MNNTLLQSTKTWVVFGVGLIISACLNNLSARQTQELNSQLEVVVDSISELMSRYHYNPEELSTKTYRDIDSMANLLPRKTKSKEDFVNAYNKLWEKGPFSHVRLGFMQNSAKDMATFIDTLRVGPRGAVLEWMDKTAILTVTTMTGVDTKERVLKAYRQIAEKATENLIIDLRNNEGGTFAGIPLIAHLLADSTDIGIFVSPKWWRNYTNPPSMEDTKNLQPWQGWSIQTFWQDVQENPLTRIRLSPMEPRFEGEVYALISDKTFSAAEMTADAMANVENLTMIGETTAGEMLSQKIYDLPMGLQLSLPIADYYSVRTGRIEGKGVEPDIKIDPLVAKELALALIDGIELEKAMALTKSKLSQMYQQPFDGKTLHLFGNMNNWGKEWNKTPKFKYRGNGVFTTVLKLSKGNYEFKIAPMDWNFDFGAFEDNKQVSVEKRIPLIK